MSSTVAREITRLRQPIYREFQALDVHQQLELGMREEVAAQEILQLRFVEAARVGVVVGDVLEHVARVARFGGGFDARR